MRALFARRPAPFRRLLPPALAALLLLAPAAGGAPYRKGDRVTISGVVSDSGGAPIGNVTVLLEVSKTSFELRRMRRVKGNTLQIPVIADADGKYRHEWRWDGYYNTFGLAVAMPVPGAGGEVFEVVRRFEITQPVMEGGPVEVPLMVQDAAYLQWLRRFSDGSASSEEKRVFLQLGRPDRLDLDGKKAAWWYFAAGKVYRFVGGTLEEVETFEPIEPP